MWEDFTTVIKEVETIVNSHPLIYQDNDSGDAPVMLSHLLQEQDLFLLPPLRIKMSL